MRLLLDSHVVIELFAQPGRFAANVLRALRDPANVVAVSAASVWEIEVKRVKGGLRAPTDLVGRLETARFEPLPITFPHAVAAARLPPHHRDPFDRLLVAQAQLEGLTIVTRDPKIRLYQVAVLEP
jgi:PIN domain nuclease of toxin-antitoxin system